MKTLIAMLVIFAAYIAHAPAQTAKVQWSARDTAGKDVVVPLAAGPTIVAFLRPGQAQSDEALQRISDVAAKSPAARVVIVLSGPDNSAASAKLANKAVHAVVLDADYVISGQMAVHVWPETILVTGDGVEAARLAGLPHSFSTDLAAHVDFAINKIDAATRDNRLTTRKVVAATSQQAATRYLIIADALIERDQLDQARSEIERGIRTNPAEPTLRIALARVLLKQKQFSPALQVAEQLKDAVPPWQCNQLRAEALVGLERWADAKAAVADALKLNPKPAQAHFLAGLVSSHEKDFEHAADSFRRAYEAAEKERRR